MKKTSFILLFLSLGVIAKPLNLNDAINTALENDSDYKQILLQVKTQENNLKNLNSYNLDLTLNLETKDRFNDRIDNSKASLNFSKSLFNQDDKILNTNYQNEIDLLKTQLKTLQLKKKLEVLRAFFNIIIADMNYDYLMEDLAVFAVMENRIKDYIELEYYSEVELLERTSKTQEALVKMRSAENDKLISRAQLGMIMGLDANEEIAEIIEPQFTNYLSPKLDIFKTWQDKILTGNTELQILSTQINNLKQNLGSEQTNYGIDVSLYSKIFHHQFESDKNGNYLAGLQLSIPLGAENRNTLDNLNIEIKSRELTFNQQKNQILTKALELWLKAKNLVQQQKSLQVMLDYKDLYLERARANYELELKSDIGHSMTEYTKTEKLIKQNEFDIITTMQELHLLAGEDYVKID
jgi:outer membrane protein TolC